MTQYNLGICLAVLGEQERDPERMDEAMESIRNAHEEFVSVGAPGFRDLAMERLIVIERKAQTLQRG